MHNVRGYLVFQSIVGSDLLPGVYYLMGPQ